MPGIYVERRVHGSLDELWHLTQTPAVPRRWDLRFTSITYLRHTPGAAQRFLYETSVLPGLTVRGTGETLGQRTTPEGTATSGLKFAVESTSTRISQPGADAVDRRRNRTV